jgi:peptide/nickel transport system substrate-binding protein
MPRTILPRALALLLLPALAVLLSACPRQPEGTVKVVVIGGEPKLRDPAEGPLTAPDAVLLENVAQGLVRFDAGGNIVGGLAERWNVSDDGLSYIFRLASGEWPDHRKITAQQVARLLKREIGQRSKNQLKDTFGAVEDVVAMTDRVIEIRLIAPRPNLLALLAQPEMAVIRDGLGTGPFTYSRNSGPGSGLRLTREVSLGDDETSRRDEVVLSGATAQDAIRDFAAERSSLVLGGTFADLPYAQRIKLPRRTLQFDPASGLFGLVPLHSGGVLDDADLRRLLSQAIDRDALIAAFGVPGLAARATVLESGLDGIFAPVAPAWFGTAFGDRLTALRAQSDRMFGKAAKPAIRVALPDGPGSDLLFQLLSRNWGALGFTVERAPSLAAADLALIDEVAPSSSPAWFVRRFRCDAAAVCDPDTDKLIDAARLSQIPAQRYALLAQAAGRIDDAQLFIPLAAPVRWSLVSSRITGFAGNRFARHTLTDLEQKPGSGD